MTAQVLRIYFKSGRVVERRGDDETVAAIYHLDEEKLVDYVASMEVETGFCAFYTRLDDSRFDEEQILIVDSELN